LFDLIFGFKAITNIAIVENSRETLVYTGKAYPSGKNISPVSMFHSINENANDSETARKTIQNLLDAILSEYLYNNTALKEKGIKFSGFQ
jgi:hypothetical protein